MTPSVSCDTRGRGTAPPGRSSPTRGPSPVPWATWLTTVTVIALFSSADAKAGPTAISTTPGNGTVHHGRRFNDEGSSAVPNRSLRMLAMGRLPDGDDAVLKATSQSELSGAAIRQKVVALALIRARSVPESCQGRRKHGITSG